MILIWQKASGVGCLLKYDKAEGQMLLTTMHRNPTQSTAAIQIGSCDGKATWCPGAGEASCKPDAFSLERRPSHNFRGLQSFSRISVGELRCHIFNKMGATR